MFCAWLVALTIVDGKASVIGFKTTAAAAVPVPESVAVA
jgi:hypothetical protein